MHGVAVTSDGSRNHESDPWLAPSLSSALSIRIAWLVILSSSGFCNVLQPTSQTRARRMGREHRRPPRLSLATTATEAYER